MKKLIAVLCVLSCAVVASAGVVVTPAVNSTDTASWRGWNNTTTTGWLDSWGNATDWGTSSFADAVCAKYDRATIQAAIATVGAGYDAYLQLRIQGATGGTSYGTTPAQVSQALAFGRPAGGVFDVPQVPGVAFNTIQGQNGGWNFENNTRASASSMFTETNAWTWDVDPTVGNAYMLTLRIGSAIVDKYLNDPASDGFFMSWMSPTGTINAGERLEAFDRTSNPLQLLIVPEPATMGLIGLGALAIIRRRR